jgi:hypothetical protein
MHPTKGHGAHHRWCVTQGQRGSWIKFYTTGGAHPHEFQWASVPKRARACRPQGANTAEWLQIGTAPTPHRNQHNNPELFRFHTPQ